MTDKQFEKIKKGLIFHSENGIENLCTLTETALRELLEDATKELEAQIEKMKCGGNCKFEYWKNTGGCYDQKCRFTGLDCTNCKDKWKGKWEND